MLVICFLVSLKMALHMSKMRRHFKAQEGAVDSWGICGFPGIMC